MDAGSKMWMLMQKDEARNKLREQRAFITWLDERQLIWATSSGCGVHQKWSAPPAVAYTQSGLHHQQWSTPKVVYTTRRGPHHQQWSTPKMVYTTRRGSHHQLWCTTKVVHTTSCGSHQKLFTPSAILTGSLVANYSSADSLTIQKILRRSKENPIRG